MIKRGYCGGRRLRGLAVIGAASLVLLGVPIGARGQEIRVKFLNAKTGRPVTYEAAAIWVKSARLFLLSAPANKEGTAKFFYTGHSIRAIWPPGTKLRYSWMGELAVPPGIVRIAAAPTVDAGFCWDLGPSHRGPWYRISEILQHGEVSQNHCGKATAKAEPGEIILFIKPKSFWRRFLDGWRM